MKKSSCILPITALALFAGCLTLSYFAASHRNRGSIDATLEPRDEHVAPRSTPAPNISAPRKDNPEASAKLDAATKLSALLKDPRQWEAVLKQDLSLSESARELLSLTEKEAAQLEATLAAYKKKSKDSELERMEVRQEDMLTIILQPAPNGEALRREFEMAITSQLGADRSTSFLLAARRSLWLGCGDFGRVARKIRVEPESDGWRIHLYAIEGTVGAEQPTTRSDGTAFYVQEVPEDLAHLMTRE